MRIGQLPSFNASAVNPLVPGLLTGYGEPARGRLISPANARGIAKVEVRRACLRCGGGGGSDKWAYTGWTCFDCGGKGEGLPGVQNAYTPAAFEKLNARRQKLAAKRAAEYARAEAARRAPYEAWKTAHAHLLSEISARAPEDLKARVFEGEAGARIPPAWLLDVAVLSILRDGIRADQRAASRHVGEVGKRIILDLTCEKLIDLSEGSFPRRYFYIALMRDGAGNRIVYKGGNPPLGDHGENSGRFKVTVKEHSERDGERQTIIQRPAAVE